MVNTLIVPILNVFSCLGDLGGPLVIEGDSAETDILFGITSAGKTEYGFHIMYFANLPYHIDTFISPYLRGIEKVHIHFSNALSISDHVL